MMYRLLTLCCALLVASGLGAQSREKDELQRKKIRLQDEIELANSILQETRENKEMSVSQVQALMQKIAIRERLVRTMQKEVEWIQEDMEEIEERIQGHNVRIERLNNEYASMIRGARRSQSHVSRLMFILSSKNFNQAIKRLEYMKQLAEHRRRQLERIREEQKALEEDLKILKETQREKEQLLRQQEVEVLQLQEERSSTEVAIADLRTREKALQKEIKEKKKQSDLLEKEIQRIIEEEIKRAKDRALRRQLEDEADALGLKMGKDFSKRTSNRALKALIKKKKKADGRSEDSGRSPVYKLTPEAKKLAANFKKNRGKLPWPVEKGIVTSSFGKHPHPVAKDVIVNNNGIDIASEKGGSARAVFNGEVSRVIRIPYGNKAVLIRHGNYFTVYDNLVQVYVKEGDRIKTKQEIGLIFTDPKDGRTQLHFEIWLADKVQNPKPWLYRK